MSAVLLMSSLLGADVRGACAIGDPDVASDWVDAATTSWA